MDLFWANLVVNARMNCFQLKFDFDLLNEKIL